MRHSLPFLMFLMLFPGLIGAQVSAESQASNEAEALNGAQAPSVVQAPKGAHPFYLGLGGTLEMSANNRVPGYGMGPGFDAAVGYRFDKDLAFQVQVDNFYYYASDSRSIYMVRPLAKMKLSFDLEDYFRPYLFAGPGLNLNVFYIPEKVSTSLDLVLSGGGGIEFDLGEFSLYAEGEYDYLFHEDEPADSPFMQSIPLEIGLLHSL